MRIAAGAGVLLAVAAAWIWRGDFLNASLAVAGVAAGAGLLAARLALRPWSGRPWIDRARGVFLFVGVLAAAHAVSWPAGYAVNRLDVRDARAYCDLVIEAAERHREEQGLYPHSWEELDRPDRSVPRLLPDPAAGFVSDGEAFVLSFSEADAFLPHTFLYSSADGSWQRF